jgi:hypothetical protein
VPQLEGLLLDPREGRTRLVELAWEADRGLLRLRAEGLDYAVPARSLAVSTGGWQGRTVRLSWTEGDESWVLTVSDPEAVRSIAGALALALGAQLHVLLALLLVLLAYALHGPAREGIVGRWSATTAAERHEAARSSSDYLTLRLQHRPTWRGEPSRTEGS